MKEKLQRFMMGRYGVDELGKFSLYFGLALIVINLFLPSRLLNALIFLLLVITYFRMFSRNYEKRRKENNVYLKYFNKVRYFFSKQKYMAGERKDFHIYTCPNCKQKIRIPRGKGKISITCPKCKTEFIKKS